MLPSRPFARLALALAVAAPLACHDGGPEDGDHGFYGALEARFLLDTVSPGETAEIRVQLPTRSDNAPFTVTATYGGMARGVDTLTVPGLAGTLSGTLAIPPGAPDGELSITFAVTGTRYHDTARLYVHDNKPPEVEGFIEQLGGPPMVTMMAPHLQLLAGGRVMLHPKATDNGNLRWLGYELGAPFNVRDSALVDGQFGYASLPLDIPAAYAGSAPIYTVFARDAAGNRRTVALGPASVYRYLDRVAGVATLDAPFRDVAYDAVRDRLYFSQRELGRVAVLSVPTMTWLAPIAMPAPPTGLDLTVGGDSLLVGLERTTYLGVVDLRASSPTVDTLRLRYAIDSTVGSGFAPVSPSPDQLRVAADGRALVSLLYAGVTTPVSSQSLMTVDLASGAQAFVPQGTGIATRLTLTRSGDRSTIVGIGAPTATGLLRYLAAVHDFSVPATALPYGTEWPLARSADAGGRFYMFGKDLFDENVRPLRPIGIDGYESHYTALSPDGADAYAANRMACTYGSPPPCPSEPIAAPSVYLRLSSAASDLREVVRTPELATTLLPLPDGRRMITIGATKVALFDLTAAGARALPLTAMASMRSAPALVAPSAGPELLPRVRWVTSR